MINYALLVDRVTHELSSVPPGTFVFSILQSSFLRKCWLVCYSFLFSKKSWYINSSLAQLVGPDQPCLVPSICWWEFRWSNFHITAIPFSPGVSLIGSCELFTLWVFAHRGLYLDPGIWRMWQKENETGQPRCLQNLSRHFLISPFPWAAELVSLSPSFFITLPRPLLESVVILSPSNSKLSTGMCQRRCSEDT